MRKFTAVSTLAAASGILLLILDSKTALSCAQEGMQLIISTVIPSLFPFFFLSIWLTSSAGTVYFPLLQPLGRLFQMPNGTEYLLIPAFLGGYPAGAQAVASAWKQGAISKQTAERLLSFCSNAGPSFLFGILSAMFPEQNMVWLLWLLHILGAFWAGRCLLSPTSETITPPDYNPKSFAQILNDTIHVMATVSGWVLLFRILIGFLNKWFLGRIPADVRVLLTGLTEMTNGCCSLHQIPDCDLRFIICCVILSCGGLCVTMQTLSVTNGLSMHYYVRGKLIQTTFAAAAGCVILYRNWTLLFLLVFLLFSFANKRKKSSIPLPSGV